MRIGLVFKPCVHFYLCLFIGLTSTSLFASTTFTLSNGEVLQDPTKPKIWNLPTQTASEQQEASFKLNYIVSSGQERRAMINGQKVVVGDVVAGAKVQQINSDSVYLLYKGKHKEIRMNKIKGIKRN